jgi:hypothetical protein
MRRQAPGRWPSNGAAHIRRVRGGTWRSPLLVVSCLLLVVAAVLLGVLPGGALVAAAAQRGTASPAPPAGHVTVLVLDMSGSMGNPGIGGNDPQGLRCSAANAYIDLSGPGDFVGVVGLANTTGARGGPHNFETADWSIQPSELSTVARRQQLRGAIQQQSSHCAGNGGTPTYDALAKAEAMLARATNGGAIPGSAILLTDGVPDPGTGAQVVAIKSDLVSQFKAHNWPIDTVALGQDSGGFHSFLSDVASATSGAFYDDGHGVVPGVSPLNIAPFFIDIFRLRNGRSPGPDIPPTTLSGGTTARNFDVGQYVSHLDIVVVKDSAHTRVSLVAPNGQRFPPAAAGTFISTDPYYAIFAIDTPQTGTWELDVSGSGQFLMDSLKVSTLSLLLTSPNASAVLALGEPFTISAVLSNQGTPISGGQFNLTGTISYAGGASAAPYTQDVVLTDTTGSGTYSAPVTVPTAAPTGSYQIVVKAHSASEDVLTTQMVLRMDLFPAALLISPTTGKVTSADLPLAGAELARQRAARRPSSRPFGGGPRAGGAERRALLSGDSHGDGGRRGRHDTHPGHRRRRWRRRLPPDLPRRQLRHLPGDADDGRCVPHRARRPHPRDAHPHRDHCAADARPAAPRLPVDTLLRARAAAARLLRPLPARAEALRRARRPGRPA